MKNRCYLFASAFMLATMPLLADNVQSEEIALDTQETAQYGNRRSSLGSKQDDGKRCREKNVPIVPEEQAIEAQRTVITPSVYPYVSNGSNTFASVDFIWWKSVIGGTGYAYTGSSDGSASTPVGTSVTSGYLKRPDYSFEPGCKLALGTHFHHDGWDVKAEWTFLSGPERENGTTAAFGEGGKTIIPITTGADGVVAPISFVHAKSEYKQDFNVIDAELGRNFFVSKYLSLRPHVGLKTAWLHTTMTYTFVPTTSTSDARLFGFDTVLAAYAKRQQHMWGIGLRGGIDSKWYMTKNWAIYGDLAFTTLWADFHVKSSDMLTEDIAGVYKSSRYYYSVQTVIPVIEAGVGLSYINWFCDNTYRIEVQAGWEEQVWLDYNYFQQQGFGSLTTQGLTFKVGLTF